MKPYKITIARNYKRGDVTYTVLAKDREDAIDFARRVHKIDFKKVVSCHIDKDAQATIPHYSGE